MSIFINVEWHRLVFGIAFAVYPASPKMALTLYFGPASICFFADGKWSVCYTPHRGEQRWWRGWSKGGSK